RIIRKMLNKLDVRPDLIAADLARLNTIHPGLGDAAADYVTTGHGETVLSTLAAKGHGGKLVISQRYGQGKVVAIFTDTLWKWKLHPNAIETRPYQRFWDQLISWLLPEEEELEKDRLDILADQESLVLGEEIKINARLGGENEAARVDVRCEITKPDGTVAPFSMRPELVTTAGGKSYPGFATAYKATDAGLHTIVANTTLSGKKIVSDPISFFVKPFSPESMPRPANVAVLENVAQSSGGKYFKDLETLDETLSKLTYKQIEEELSEFRSLWQNPVLIGGLMLLATISWVTRKLNNMP
ncbi:MAG: hypothetical protein AAF492_21500, partial [Verrucomicrobiota bacterium]